LYIHPKEPEQISDEFRQFIIPSLIETSWGHRSIVEATILLLEQAILDRRNEWFILCSQDSFPCKSYADFLSFFETQTISIFNVTDHAKNKTSQWWALCRADVELLLENKSKFNEIFESISKRYRKIDGAIDELFFLNAFTKIKRDYVFKNGCIHYDKWCLGVVSKHPAVFNRLLEEDIRHITENSCWFIRKTFPTFKNKLIDKKSNCIIMCIGSSSKDNYSSFLNYFADKANIFLFVIDEKKIENQDELKEKCEQLYYGVWREADSGMEILYNKFLPLYENVIVLKEEFDYMKYMGFVNSVEQTILAEFLKTNRDIYKARITTVATNPELPRHSSLPPPPPVSQFRSSHQEPYRSFAPPTRDRREDTRMGDRRDDTRMGDRREDTRMGDRREDSWRGDTYYSRRRGGRNNVFKNRTKKHYTKNKKNKK
jgi:hypothetical protein